jgi:hypothetical protein
MRCRLHLLKHVVRGVKPLTLRAHLGQIAKQGHCSLLTGILAQPKLIKR